MPTSVGKWTSQEQTKLEELRLSLIGEIASQASLTVDVPLLVKDTWVKILQLNVPKFGEFLLLGRLLISSSTPAQTVHFLGRMKINNVVIASVQSSPRGPIGTGRVAESLAFAVPLIQVETMVIPVPITLEVLASVDDAIVHAETPYMPSGASPTRMLVMLIEKYPLGGI